MQCYNRDYIVVDQSTRFLSTLTLPVSLTDSAGLPPRSFHKAYFASVRGACRHHCDAFTGTVTFFLSVLRPRFYSVILYVRDSVLSIPLSAPNTCKTPKTESFCWSRFVGCTWPLTILSEPIHPFVKSGNRIRTGETWNSASEPEISLYHC